MKQLVKLFGHQTRERISRKNRRPLRNELLEQRQLLAGDILVAHNYTMPEDVNGDWKVTPLDALLVLNHVARDSSPTSLHGMTRGDLPNHLDVTGDNEVTPLDALLVLNRIARGEAESPPLIELELNPRTAEDGSFGAAFNAANRELIVDIGQAFNLEVLYRDLRTPDDARIGAFTMFANIASDQIPDGIFEPVLGEMQLVELSAAFAGTRGGSIDFSFPDRPGEVYTRAVTGTGITSIVRDAYIHFGYDDIEVRAIPRSSSAVPPDPYLFQVRFDNFTYADRDIPNIIVTPRVTNIDGQPITVAATTRDLKPRLDDGSANPALVRESLNFESRTLPIPNLKFYGQLVYGGTFDPAVGFLNVGGVADALVGGWSGYQLNLGQDLPSPFDSFSVPVRVNQVIDGLEFYVQPPTNTSSLITLFGSDDPLPDDLIQINRGGNGSIFVMAESPTGVPITVQAGNASRNVAANGPGTEISLAELIVSTGGDEQPSIEIFDQPEKGYLEIDGTNVTYIPFAGETGADSFGYIAIVNGIRGYGRIDVSLIDTATVVAQDGSLSTFENGLPVSLNLNTLISTIPVGTAVTIELVDGSGPAFGSVQLAANGVVTYTPTDQIGTTSFRYRATTAGPEPTSDEGVISVTVNPEITLVADDAAFNATQSGPLIVIDLIGDGLVQTTGVPNGVNVAFSIDSSGTQGTVMLNNGVITYDPPDARFTSDSFTYTATIPPIPGFAGLSESGTISITEVASLTARNQSLTILAGDDPRDINLAALVTVTGTDDTPTFEIFTTSPPLAAPLQGTADLDGSVVTYEPPATEFGSTLFTYRVTVAGLEAFGTITISEGVSIETSPGSLISNPGGPPVQIDLKPLVTIAGSEEAPTFGISTMPSVGTAQVNPVTGILTYTPPQSGSFGELTFNYSVTVDDVTESGTITVTELTVNAPNRTLSVAEQPVSGGQPNSATLALTATVSVDLPVGFSIVTNGSLGTATIQGDQLTYTPNAFNLNQTQFTDTIVYRATVNGVSDTGTVTVTINPIVLPPVANPDTIRVTANIATTFPASRLLGNDEPARPFSGEPIVITAFPATTQAGGTLVRNGDGSFTYTPPAGVSEGTDQFQYTITSNGLTAVGVVTLDIQPFTPSTISGSIFTDYIESLARPVRNGVQDANEPSVGGVPVRLTSPANSNLFEEDIDIVMLTNSDGQYAFRDLPPGTYQVTFEVPNVLIFGQRVDSSGTSSGGTTTSFQVVIGPDGGVQASGLNFTVLGRTGLASGSGALLASDYAATNPSWPPNASNPDFGLATMIVNPSSGLQQLFELTTGFDNVLFAQIAIGQGGGTALLTLILDDGSAPMTYFLSRDNGDFILSSNGAVVRVLKNYQSMTPLESMSDWESITSKHANYRQLVDQVLGSWE